MTKLGRTAVEAIHTVKLLGQYRFSYKESATGLRAGRPRNWDSILGRSKKLSLLCNFQTGSGAHPASYPVGTGGSFPGA
jgi:hypothetical protein